MNSANSSTFGVSGGEYSSLSTLSEDFPADLIQELEAAAATNGNDQMVVKMTEERDEDREREIKRCSINPGIVISLSLGGFDVVVLWCLVSLPVLTRFPNLPPFRFFCDCLLCVDLVLLLTLLVLRLFLTAVALWVEWLLLCKGIN